MTCASGSVTLTGRQGPFESQPGDFDYAGQEQGREELGAMLTDPTAVAFDGPVHVHFDPDVLDPAENPIPYGRAGGLTTAQVIELATRLDVSGLEVTAFHSHDDPAIRAEVADRIVAIIDAGRSNPGLPVDDASA